MVVLLRHHSVSMADHLLHRSAHMAVLLLHPSAHMVVRELAGHRVDLEHHAHQAVPSVEAEHAAEGYTAVHKVVADIAAMVEEDRHK